MHTHYYLLKILKFGYEKTTVIFFFHLNDYKCFTDSNR